MDQVIKILALSNNQILISEVVEVAAMDIGQPDCKLVNPCLITEGKMLEPYLNDYTRDSTCLLYTSPSPRDVEEARMPSSA